MPEFHIKTHKRDELIDVTDLVAQCIQNSKKKEGLAVVFIPHTTAGVTINENADPDVVHDILLTLNELVPRLRPAYRHGEGNSDAHVKSSLGGPSLTIPFQNGQMALGTWQGIYFCEFDGPRNRSMQINII